MKCHRCGTVVPGKIDGQTKPLPPVPSSFDRLASTLRGDIFLRVLCEDCSGEGYPQLLRLHLSWYHSRRGKEGTDLDLFPCP